MKYTPLQTVNKCHRELWWTIRLIESAEVQLDENCAARVDLAEVEKVLRAAVQAVDRILHFMQAERLNERNQRLGTDLALKAQIAKKLGVAVSSLKLRQDDQSHK